MRVLIAVNNQRRLQTHRPGEAVDGEIVTPVVLECTEPASCPCDHSWAGLATGGFSALAEVADRPNMTEAQLRRAIHGLLDDVGVIGGLIETIEADDVALDGGQCDDPVWAIERMIDDHVAQIEAICESFPIGAVLSRLGDLVAPTVGSRAA
jgi:hypothetical protein